MSARAGAVAVPPAAPATVTTPGVAGDADAMPSARAVPTPSADAGTPGARAAAIPGTHAGAMPGARADAISSDDARAMPSRRAAAMPRTDAGATPGARAGAPGERKNRRERMSRPDRILELSRYAFAEAVVAARLGELPSRAVFDIGAGDGRLREPLERHGLTWHGFDRDPTGAAERWDLDAPYRGDKGPAGVALMLDVVEHCANPGRALDNVAGVLADGALLVMTMPNPSWSRARLDLLRTGFLTCFTERDLALNHHVFTPWPHVVAKLLDDAGLDVVETATLGGLTRPFAPPRSLGTPLRVAAAALMRAIEHADPAAAGMSFAVVARRRPRPRRPQ